MKPRHRSEGGNETAIVQVNRTEMALEGLMDLPCSLDVATQLNGDIGTEAQRIQEVHGTIHRIGRCRGRVTDGSLKAIRSQQDEVHQVVPEVDGQCMASPLTLFPKEGFGQNGAGMPERNGGSQRGKCLTQAVVRSMDDEVGRPDHGMGLRPKVAKSRLGLEPFDIGRLTTQCFWNYGRRAIRHPRHRALGIRLQPFRQPIRTRFHPGRAGRGLPDMAACLQQDTSVLRSTQPKHGMP